MAQRLTPVRAVMRALAGRAGLPGYPLHFEADARCVLEELRDLGWDVTPRRPVKTKRAGRKA